MPDKYEKELAGIRAGETAVLRRVYRLYFPAVEQMVRNTNGSPADAQDVFQEALIIVYDKLQRDDLQLSSTIQTYIYAVCRKLWLNMARRKYRELESTELSIPEQAAPEDILHDIERHERYRLYQRHFASLAEGCRNILRMFFEGHALKQIAQAQGVESENYIKTRKYKCKKALIAAIKQDLEYRELVSDDGR